MNVFNHITEGSRTDVCLLTMADQISWKFEAGPADYWSVIVQGDWGKSSISFYHLDV